MSAERTSFAVIFLLWGAGLGAAAQYGKVSVIFDQLPRVYPDAGAAIGFVVSVVGLIGIVFGVVASLLVSRIGYRRALLWALWGGAAVSLAQAALPPLPVMLALRALEGVSHLAIVVAAPTFIAQLSTPAHRGVTLTLWSTFFGVAFTGLVWGGLPLVAARGIPALFVAHGMWMALFAGLLTFGLPRLHAAETSPAGRMSLGRILRDHLSIYRSARIAAPGLGWLFYTFCFLALLTLLPLYLAPENRAWVIGAMPLVSIAVSMTLGVWLFGYISAIALVMWGFAGVAACLVWLLAAPGGVAACLALAGALGLVQGASFAAVPQINDTPETQAQANGAMAQMGNMGNTLGTPVLATIAQATGYAAMIMTALAVILAGLALHAVLAQRRRAGA